MSFDDLPIQAFFLSLQDALLAIAGYSLDHLAATIALALYGVTTMIAHNYRIEDREAMDESPWEASQSKLNKYAQRLDCFPHVSWNTVVWWGSYLVFVHYIFRWVAGDWPFGWLGWVVCFLASLIASFFLFGTVSTIWGAVVAFMALALPPFQNGPQGLVAPLLAVIWIGWLRIQVRSTDPFQAFFWKAEALALLHKQKELDALLANRLINKVEPRVVAHLKAHHAFLADKSKKDAGAVRTSLRLKSHILRREWPQAAGVLRKLPEKDAIDRILEMEASEERDRLLLPLLHQAGRTDLLGEQLQRYAPAAAVSLVEATIPEGPGRDTIMVGLWASRGDWKKLARTVEAWPAQRATSALMPLPDSPERNRMLTGAWLKSGDADAFAAFFERLPTEAAKALLTDLPPTPMRDRFLARIFHREGNPEQAAALLAPLAGGKEELAIGDLRCLVECLDASGNSRQALEIVERIVVADRLDANTVVDLCARCVHNDAPGRLLPGWTVLQLDGLGPAALRACITYFGHFKKPEMARAAATMAMLRHKDGRAARYLGWLAEKQGDLAGAINCYSSAGAAGNLSRGICLLKSSQWQAALDALAEVPVGPENRTTLFYHRGYALYRLGRLEEALDAYGRIDPDNADPAIRADCTALSCRLGLRAIAAGDYSSAADYFSHGLKQTPAGMETGGIRQHLGYCYQRMAMETLKAPGDGHDEADRMIQNARRYSGDGAPHLDTLSGLARIKARQAAAALASLPRSSKAPPILFHRALAAAGGQDPAYGRKVFQALLAAGGKTPYAARSAMLLAAMDIRDGQWAEAEKRLNQIKDGEVKPHVAG